MWRTAWTTNDTTRVVKGEPTCHAKPLLELQNHWATCQKHDQLAFSQSLHNRASLFVVNRCNAAPTRPQYLSGIAAVCNCQAVQPGTSSRALLHHKHLLSQELKIDWSFSTLQYQVLYSYNKSKPSPPENNPMITQKWRSGWKIPYAMMCCYVVWMLRDTRSIECQDLHPPRQPPHVMAPSQTAKYDLVDTPLSSQLVHMPCHVILSPTARRTLKHTLKLQNISRENVWRTSETEISGNTDRLRMPSCSAGSSMQLTHTSFTCRSQECRVPKAGLWQWQHGMACSCQFLRSAGSQTIKTTWPCRISTHSEQTQSHHRSISTANEPLHLDHNAHASYHKCNTRHSVLCVGLSCSLGDYLTSYRLPAQGRRTCTRRLDARWQAIDGPAGTLEPPSVVTCCKVHKILLRHPTTALALQRAKACPWLHWSLR